MRSRSIKNLFCLAVGVFAATVQASTLPLSQLPAIGTNQITVQDFVPADNYQGANPVTVRIPISLLQSNFVTAVLSNLVTTINPAISTNPPTIANDILFGTNADLVAFNVGGDIASAATQTNAVVLALGDSMTEGNAGVPSTSMIFGIRIRAIYGDDGVSGANAAYGGGWANNPTIFNRVPPTNVWVRYGIAEISLPDGTNADTAQQGAAGSQYASNICNQVGVCYVASQWSTNFSLTIWSPSAGVTNFYTIADNATSPNFRMTNWAVASAYDWHIACSSLGGTNYLICANFLATNRGVQFWSFGYGGYCNDQLLTVGSNMWAQIYAAINPTVVLYNSIHLGTAPGDTSLATHTNLMRNLLANCPTNTRVVVVGNPPNVGGDTRVVNGYNRMACSSFGFFYADLWNAFPSFTTAWNAGLFQYGDGGVHPSLTGAYARSAVLLQKCGIGTAGPVPLDLRNVSGQINTNNLPAAAVTTNQASPILLDAIIAKGPLNAGFKILTAASYSPTANEEFGFFGNGGIGFYSGGGVNCHYAEPVQGVGTLTYNTGFGGALTVTNAAALGTVSTATATAGNVTVTNGVTASTVTASNLCLAGQFGGITQFYVNANGSNSITVPAGKSYYVTWNSARNLNTLIWTNGYGVGSPVTITNLAWPAPGNLILKSGWILSVYDNSGFPAGGVYYPL